HTLTGSASDSESEGLGHVGPRFFAAQAYTEIGDLRLAGLSPCPPFWGKTMDDSRRNVDRAAGLSSLPCPPPVFYAPALTPAFRM
ncbi:MAG TPA: hypothetical protein VM912_09650, partial [Terriglobales bacterium]|nr:hypothetical protein [Terriglobales bacterium]